MANFDALGNFNIDRLRNISRNEALAIGAATAGGALAVKVCRSYFSAQNYEEKYLKAFSVANQNLVNHLSSSESLSKAYHEIMKSEGSEFAKMKSFQEYAKGIKSDPQLEKLLEEYFSKAEVYSKNLAVYIDQEIAGTSIEEKYKAAAHEADIDEMPKSKERAEYFLQKLEAEYLGKGEETEEGAFARLLQAERDSIVARHIHSSLKTDEAAESNLVLKHQNFTAARAKYQNLVQKAFPAKTEEKRDLLLQLGDDFPSRGKRKILQTIYTDKLDAVVKVGFSKLYQDFQKKAANAAEQLKRKLVTYDPALGGNSRWRLFIFSWIYYAASSWILSKRITPLKNSYELLKGKIEEEEPFEPKKIKEFLSENEEVLKALGEKRKAAFEATRKTYQTEAETQLTAKSQSEPLEIYLAGDKKTQLEKCYKGLKGHHPSLKNVKDETIQYEETLESLHITARDFEIWIGNEALEKVKGDLQEIISQDISGNGDSPEIPAAIFTAFFPQQIQGWIKWKAGKREVIYSNENKGSIAKVGPSGLSDMVHSRLVSSERIIYSCTKDSDKKGPESSITFEGDCMRAGLYLKENVSRLLSGSAVDYINQTEGSQETLIIKRIGKYRNDQNEIRMLAKFELNNDESKLVPLEKGERLLENKAKRATIKFASRFTGVPRVGLSLQEFKDTFCFEGGVVWKSI